MPDKDRRDEEPEFKVVDRRQFTPEGEKREGAELRPPETERAPLSPQQAPPDPGQSAGRVASGKDPKQGEAKSQPSPEPQTAEAQGAQTPRRHAGPASFDQLVMSLATTAMYQMGLVGNPGDERPPVDLAGAKESIDLLDILQKKTAGNLTEDEAGLLEGSIYELRMVFVELTKAGRGR